MLHIRILRLISGAYFLAMLGFLTEIVIIYNYGDVSNTLLTKQSFAIHVSLLAAHSGLIALQLRYNIRLHNKLQRMLILHEQSLSSNRMNDLFLPPSTYTAH